MSLTLTHLVKEKVYWGHLHLGEISRAIKRLGRAQHNATQRWFEDILVCELIYFLYHSVTL